MNLKKLYTTYGAILIACGLVGFMLTHAKSALISGLVSGAIMIILSLFVLKNVKFEVTTKIFNALFALVFSWRFSVVLQKLAEDPEKLIPALLLGSMAVFSIGTLVLAIKK